MNGAQLYFAICMACLLLFFGAIVIGAINYKINGPAPLPHEQTIVCNDGTTIPPGTHRENCDNYGGFDRFE